MLTDTPSIPCLFALSSPLLPVSLFFRPSLVVQALKSTHESLTLKAIMMPFFAIYVLAMVCLFNLP